jgi:hypothetical protein
VTGDELERAAIILLGSSYGWQTQLAKWLHVAPRTVRRWYAMDYLPNRIQRLIEAELRFKDLVEEELKLKERNDGLF